MKKRMLILVVMSLFFLSGCLSPKVYLSFEPNPITISPGDDHIEGDMIFKLSGWDIVNVEKVMVSFLDESDELIIEPFSIELYSSVPAVGEGFRQRIPLPVTYDGALVTGLSTIRFEVTGPHYARNDVKVILKDDME